MPAVHDEHPAEAGLVYDAHGRSWSYAPWGAEADGLIAVHGEDAHDPESPVGLYDGRSGHVYACEGGVAIAASCAEGPVADEPSLLFIGTMDDMTGQLKVRQPEGNYLRICRWDKLSGSTQGKMGAQLRTLPQCGCGGSLGVPKLFGSFAEMCIYHFCSFCV